MAVMCDQHQIADQTSAHLILRPLIGGFELLFMITLSVAPATDGVVRWTAIDSARVTVSAREQRDLGVVRPLKSEILQQFPADQRTQTIELAMKVSPQELAALESFREEGDLTFDLTLNGRAGTSTGPVQYPRPPGSLKVAVPKSVWARTVTEAGVFDLLLLEVAFPLPLSPDAKRLRDHLLQAQFLFREGHFEECVVHCRKAAELLPEPAGFEWDMLVNKTRREALSKDARIAALSKTVILCTHASAHATADVLGKADARLIMVAIMALAGHITRRP